MQWKKLALYTLLSVKRIAYSVRNYARQCWLAIEPVSVMQMESPMETSFSLTHFQAPD